MLRAAIRMLVPSGLVAVCVLTVSCGGSNDLSEPEGSFDLIASWEMDEPSGASTLLDSGPQHLDGTIGSQVETGVQVQGATAHRRSVVAPDAPPVAADRLTQVPHDGRLDPGDDDYAVTVVLRTTSPQGNVVQKGQNGFPGGYFKVDMDEGRVACLFMGADGKSHVRSTEPVADGSWHEVRCTRMGDELVLDVDGAEVARRASPTGSIANTSPVTVAGKYSCDQIKVFCDYFSGDLDRVVFERGAPGM